MNSEAEKAGDTPNPAARTASLRATMSGQWRDLFPLLSLIALIGVVTGGIVLLGSLSLERVLLSMLVTLVAVVGLYVFSGTSGILSFGHVSFMAIGAYASALMTIPRVTKATLLPDLPRTLAFLADIELGFLPAMAIASVITLVVAFVIAIPTMRLSGMHAALSTVAVLVIVQVVIREWESVTRGRTTMVGIPRHTTIAGAFAAAAIVLTVAFLYQRSASGLRLKASREDPHAAAAVGINILVERIIAFTLGALISAVSGVLYAHMLGQINPVLFYFNMTFVTVAMLVVGGMRSLAGAVVGVLGLTFLTEALRRLHTVGGLDLPAGLTEALLALALLLIMVLRPGGIMGGREFEWAKRRGDAVS